MSEGQRARNQRLGNPMSGRKRPDNRERKERIYDAKWSELAPTLFAEYKRSRLPMPEFAKKAGYSHTTLERAFRRYLPDDYEMFVEEKMGVGLYKKGRAFEYRVRNHYRTLGYFVLRSPRSGGLVDLVAIRRGEVLFIQCKTHGYMSGQERKTLRELSDSVGARAVLASKSVHELVLLPL